MKNHIRQSFYFFLLFVVLDLFANIILQVFWPEWKRSDFVVTLFVSTWLGGLYLVSCLVRKGQYRLWLLPVCRVAFWTVIVFLGIFSGNRLAAEDFLYANNELINVWLLLGRVVDFRSISGTIELVVKDILFLGLFEWCLIYLANVLDGKNIRLNTQIL